MNEIRSGDEGWHEYRKLVLVKLEDQDKAIKELEKMRTELAVLKTKIAFYAGGISFVVAAATQYLIKANT